MASVTFWFQLQPSARVPSIAEALAARIRDPAWLLCRQWQLGEFCGADAGSPAYARIHSHSAPIDAATLGPASLPLPAGELLEPVLQSEPFTADLPTRVELGQTFDSLAGADIAGVYRGAYPIAEPSRRPRDGTLPRCLRRPCHRRRRALRRRQGSVRARPTGS